MNTATPTTHPTSATAEATEMAMVSFVDRSRLMREDGSKLESWGVRASVARAGRTWPYRGG